MNRSTYLSLALVAFTLILATFIVRGTSRLIIGERYAALLSLPIAAVAAVLLVTLVVIAVLDRTGLWPLSDDLPE